jgi:hypothetical protein
MHRNVTAIYRTRGVAELVREGLEDIGIPARDIHVIPDLGYGSGVGTAGGTGTPTTAPDNRIAGTGTGTTSPAGTAGPGREHPLHGASMLEVGAEDPVHTDRLHDLHLPEDDVRTYQHAIRHGDYVVSAEVDDARVEKVKAVMRRPETEAYDIEQRATEFRDHDLLAHSAGEGHMLNEEYRARRLALGDEDRFARTYERNRRLDLY